MEIYHFSNDYIERFENTKPKRSYSQASGHGIYFTTDYEKGLMKYGRNSKYCYVCEFTGSAEDILDLGEYDSVYFDGGVETYAEVVTANFKRYMRGEKEIDEPDIILEKLSKRAYDWLKEQGYNSIYGMEGAGYACPEFCVLSPHHIEIKEVYRL